MEEKYRRPDIEGGYIYDKSDIEYYKATQRNDVIDNGLLGDYNMVGAYVVNNAIVEELLKIKKVYTDSFGKSIFCESLKLFDDRPIKFRLNINSGIPTFNKVTASLELMEDIKRVNGFYQNTNTVLLASKVYDDKKDIDKKIFKDFNISHMDPDESGAKVENNFDVRNILLRFDSLKELKGTSISVNAKLEKKLFEKRMKVLLSSPKCASLIEEFNRQIFHSQGKFLNKFDKNYYRHINQVLDSVLQRKKLKEVELEYSKELNASLDMVYARHEQLDELRHAKDFKKIENKMQSNEVKKELEEQVSIEQPKNNDSKESIFVSVPNTSTPKEDFVKTTPKTQKPTHTETVNSKPSKGKVGVDSLLNSVEQEQGNENAEKEHRKDGKAVNSLIDEAQTQYNSEEVEENFFG